MNTIVKILVVTVILASCSPIKRHARIVKKYPYVHTTDSVKLIDTIRLTTDRVTTDTVTLTKRLKDTITLTKENLKVQVYTVRDSVYINGECDTIFIDKVIERNIPVRYYKEKPFNWKWILIGVGVFLLILFIRRKNK